MTLANWRLQNPNDQPTLELLLGVKDTRTWDMAEEYNVGGGVVVMAMRSG